MKYRVVKTAAGYAVQNTLTYTVVYVYESKAKAEQIATNLNK